MDQSVNDMIMKLIPVIIPLILLQLGLQIYCLIDLAKREKVRFNKVIWILIIVFGEILGSIVYLIFREEKSE